MTETGTVSSVGNLSTSSATMRAQITRDQFLKILITELTSQNPLEPMDTSDFLNQIVGLYNIESMASLTDGINSFYRFMHLSYASGLLNKMVKAISLEGDLVYGQVSKVILENNTVLLVVDDSKVPVENILEILPEQQE
jgi:flagellar basal-body rod modification protein FlgD